MEVERALGYVELYGAYTECEAVYGVDHLLALWDAPRRRRPGHVRLRPPRHRLGPTTSARSTCRRSSSTPGSHDARQDRRPTAPDRLRRQVLAPERQLAAFDLENTLIASNVVETLLLAGHPPPRRDERVRFVARTLARGARRCWRSTARDRGDFLRHFYRRYEDAPVEQIEADAPGAVHPADPDQVLPGRHPPGARAPRARPPHGADHRRPRLRRRAAAAAVRRHRLRPRCASDPTARCPASCSHVPPTGETRAQVLSDYARPTASTSPSRSPTPTRPATCRCSRPSASRSPSTPRPASPPSPASGAGSSSTGRKAAGGPRPLLPIGPADGRARTPPELPMTSEPDAARTEPSVAPTASAGGRAGRGRLGWPSAARPEHEGAAGPPLRRPARARSGRLGAGAVGRRAHRPAAPRRRRPARAARPGVGPRAGPGWPASAARDLSTIDGHAVAYFDRSCRFPFVPGHEVVGELDDGTRVVLEPVLGRAARGIAPPCAGAAPGDGDDCAHLAFGHLEPGLQTGFCADRRRLVHRAWSPTPASCTAVPTTCPTSGAVHGRARRLRRPRRAHGRPVGCRQRGRRPVVAVLGAGTSAWPPIAALRALRRPDARVVVGARYPHQQRAGPRSSAPTTSCPPPSWPGPCAASSAATSSATTCRSAPTP